MNTAAEMCAEAQMSEYFSKKYLTEEGPAERGGREIWKDEGWIALDEVLRSESRGLNVYIGAPALSVSQIFFVASRTHIQRCR